MQVVVSVTDLKEFALSLIDEAKNIVPEKEDKELTAMETAKILGVSTNTLWRWERDGYLIPKRVGKRPVYFQSQIDSLKK